MSSWLLSQHRNHWIFVQIAVYMPFSGVLNLFFQCKSTTWFLSTHSNRSWRFRCTYSSLSLKGGRMRQSGWTKLLQCTWEFEVGIRVGFIFSELSQIEHKLDLAFIDSPFCLSWPSVSHTGLCDDRTWEPSLSHLRRSCLCSSLLYFFFSLLFYQSSNSSLWIQNMQTLSMLNLTFNDKGYFFFQRWRRGSSLCLKFRVSVFVKSVILICYLLKKKNMLVDSWFKEGNFNLLLSLCCVKQNGCLYARMRVWKDWFLFFSFLFLRFLFFFCCFFLANLLMTQVRPPTCLIVMNIKTMIILVDVTIINYYEVLDARLYCAFLLYVFYILCKKKKKLSYFALLWTPSHRAFKWTFYCASFMLSFFVVFFYHEGKSRITVQLLC